MRHKGCSILSTTYNSDESWIIHSTLLLTIIVCLPRPSGSGVLERAAPSRSTPSIAFVEAQNTSHHSLTTYHQLRHRCQTYIARHSDCAPYRIVRSSVSFETGTASDWTGEQGGTVTFLGPRALLHSRLLLYWETLWDSHSRGSA